MSGKGSERRGALLGGGGGVPGAPPPPPGGAWTRPRRWTPPPPRPLPPRPGAPPLAVSPGAGHHDQAPHVRPQAGELLAQLLAGAQGVEEEQIGLLLGRLPRVADQEGEWCPTRQATRPFSLFLQSKMPRR